MPTGQRIQSRPELVRNTLIYLEDVELELARQIASLRNSNSREANVKDMKRDRKRTSLEIDYDGAEAELAFFKICGMYPESMFDVESKSKLKGTDRGDAIVDNYVIDVKTTRYKTGMLIQGGPKDFKTDIDIYCLITKVTDGAYVLKGFYPSKLFLTEDNYGQHFPGRPCYAVKQKALMDYDTCIKSVDNELVV